MEFCCSFWRFMVWKLVCRFYISVDGCFEMCVYYSVGKDFVYLFLFWSGVSLELC